MDADKRPTGHEPVSLAPATPEETMTVSAVLELRDGQVWLVGVGPLNAAANLARRLHAPRCVLVYESGAIGAKPVRLPLSIGDDDLAATADGIVSVPEVFNYWVGGGCIDVGFLGAAQIDRFANINTTVIGPYEQPKVRSPGAGGVRDRGAVPRGHRQRSPIPPHVRGAPDFVTSVGLGPDVSRSELGFLLAHGRDH